MPGFVPSLLRDPTVDPAMLAVVPPSSNAATSCPSSVSCLFFLVLATGNYFSEKPKTYFGEFVEGEEEGREPLHFFRSRYVKKELDIQAQQWTKKASVQSVVDSSQSLFFPHTWRNVYRAEVPPLLLRVIIHRVATMYVVTFSFVDYILSCFLYQLILKILRQC